MKRFGISFLIVILTLFVLLGSGSFTIGKMICGENECPPTYVLGKAKDCCFLANSVGETMSQPCCCQLTDVSYSLDEFNTSQKLNISPQAFNSFFSLSVFVFNQSSSLKRILSTNSSPPDPKGYLYFIGSLLL
jgi:hypothetical protein